MDTLSACPSAHRIVVIEIQLMVRASNTYKSTLAECIQTLYIKRRDYISVTALILIFRYGLGARCIVIYNISMYNCLYVDSCK